MDAVHIIPESSRPIARKSFPPTTAKSFGAASSPAGTTSRGDSTTTEPARVRASKRATAGRRNKGTLEAKGRSAKRSTEQGSGPAYAASDLPDVPAASRSTYRHGDLRNALLEAGIELARAGGARRRCVARSHAPSRRRAQRRLSPFREPGGAASGGAWCGAVGRGWCDRRRTSRVSQIKTLTGQKRAGWRARSWHRLSAFRHARAQGFFAPRFRCRSRLHPAPTRDRAAASTRSSCWAARSTEWSRPGSCRPSTGPAPNTWPGPPCMDWQCSRSTAPCVDSARCKSAKSAGACSIWSRRACSARGSAARPSAGDPLVLRLGWTSRARTCELSGSPKRVCVTRIDPGSDRISSRLAGGWQPLPMKVSAAAE